MFLSQTRPALEQRIDHFDLMQYSAPAGTYAYSTMEAIDISFTKTVKFESFWLRLHQPAEFFKKS
jgi:hypothetical protein